MPTHHHDPKRRGVGSYAALAALLAGAAYLALGAGCAVTRLKTSIELARRSEPLQVEHSDAAQRLLIAGDSTAVGTGASSPGTSLAGLIARDHPDWSIENRARDGARFADIAGQLGGAARYDIVLVTGGGNDVVRLTAYDDLRRHVLSAAQRARVLAPRVILMPAGNVGNAPIFFAPWSWWMSARARALHEAVQDAAAATGASYVNLYQDAAHDPFALEPERMNAADGLHPSDAGYALWYRELVGQGFENQRAANAAPASSAPAAR